MASTFVCINGMHEQCSGNVLGKHGNNKLKREPCDCYCKHSHKEKVTVIPGRIFYTEDHCIVSSPQAFGKPIKCGHGFIVPRCMVCESAFSKTIRLRPHKTGWLCADANECRVRAAMGDRENQKKFDVIVMDAGENMRQIAINSKERFRRERKATVSAERKSHLEEHNPKKCKIDKCVKNRKARERRALERV